MILARGARYTFTSAAHHRRIHCRYKRKSSREVFVPFLLLIDASSSSKAPSSRAIASAAPCRRPQASKATKVPLFMRSRRRFRAYTILGEHKFFGRLLFLPLQRQCRLALMSRHTSAMNSSRIFLFDMLLFHCPLACLEKAASIPLPTCFYNRHGPMLMR